MDGFMVSHIFELCHYFCGIIKSIIRLYIYTIVLIQVVVIASAVDRCRFSQSQDVMGRKKLFLSLLVLTYSVL